MNHCKNIEIKEEQVQDLTEKYDFVVVNIIDGVLLSLAPALKARVEVGGRLLLTGILEDRAEAFLPEFIGTDAIDLLQRNQKGEWVAYLLELR